MPAPESITARFIDFNCDMGEKTGAADRSELRDAALMPFISSANIACGFHAGDEDSMKKTADLAIRHRVAIGAHPSFPDRQNFGRKGMKLPFTQLYDILSEQIRLMQKVAAELGQPVHHVKPHGALYNMAARSRAMSSVIALAVKDADPALRLYGLSGSYLISEAQRIGLKTFNEVFADRTYSDDGFLTSRDKQNALIEDSASSVRQLMQMIQEGTVTTTSGKIVKVKAETVCLHSDTPQAIEMARQIHAALSGAGIKIQSSREPV
jgi:5-oxoprolinase (ATP-hydrolysing) subunit A